MGLLGETLCIINYMDLSREVICIHAKGFETIVFFFLLQPSIGLIATKQYIFNIPLLHHCGLLPSWSHISPVAYL